MSPATTPQVQRPAAHRGHPAGDRTTPASASLAVRRWIDGGPSEVVALAVFDRAVYLEVREPSLVLAVVTADGVAHPNAVVLTATSARRPLAGLYAGVRGSVGEGRLRLGDRTITVRRWWDPVPRLHPTSVAALRAATAEVEAIAPSTLGPELTDPLTRVAQALRDGDAPGAAAHAGGLLGHGPGLTPAGDDVLAGLLSGILRLTPAVRTPSASELLPTVQTAGRAIADAAVGRTTSVSAALLHHASRGEVADRAALVLRRLTGRGDRDGAVRGLLAVGSTSGADLLAGMLTAAHLVADTPDLPLLRPTPPDLATSGAR